MSSFEQVRAIRNNDEKTLRLFYQDNYLKVEKYVLENNGSIDEAKDTYQEAFLAVWRNIQLDRFHPQHQTSLNGYLYQVAKYKWLDQLRRNKKQKANSIISLEMVEELPVQLDKEEEDYLEKVKLHYATMGEPCKSVLYRFYFLNQTMNEIAAGFSWTDATAKNNKYRCLQKLRSIVLSKIISVEVRK
jgi:RNA polymerase sigma factor (sigma-70 family)